MSNWVYVCEKNEIDFEDLLWLDNEKIHSINYQ